MSPTPLCPASYPHSPATMPPSTTPHMPGTSASSAPFITWQVEVPMIATILPAATGPAAGTVTCASTLPTATAMPAGSPVSAAAAGSAARPGRRAAEMGWASLPAAKPAKRGFSAARKSRDG